MKLMGSCNDVLCWLLDRSKSVPVFLNRGSTKLIPRTKCGHIYEIHCFCAKNRSNFHPFRHNLQISFATLNLTRANTLITAMHLWGIMEASGSRRYTQLQRGCHLSQLFTLVADDGTKISRSRVLMAGPKVDIRNGCAQSEGQRKKSESVRGGRGDGGGDKGGHFRWNLCNCDRPCSCSGKCNERRRTRSRTQSERTNSFSLAIESFGGFRVWNRTILL